MSSECISRKSYVLYVPRHVAKKHVTQMHVSMKKGAKENCFSRHLGCFQENEVQGVMIYSWIMYCSINTAGWILNVITCKSADEIIYLDRI
jgi:hypothetical protein